MKVLVMTIFMSHAFKNLYSQAHIINLEHTNNNPKRPTIRRNGGRQEIFSKGQW